jgi:hypothetical protein
MSQRMIAETTCDSCGKIERREQEIRYVPSGWRHVWTGYYSDHKIVPETGKLLCSQCLARVQAAMEPAYHRGES